MLNPFVATYRAFFQATNDVEAEKVAEEIQEVMETFLDTEEGDRVVITQVQDVHVPDSTDEVRIRLALTRNDLIRFKVKPLMDLAQQLDRLIFGLENGDLQVMLNYDYGRWADLVEQVLNGGNPV